MGSQGVGVLVHARCTHTCTHTHTHNPSSTDQHPSDAHSSGAEKPGHSFCWKVSLPLESNDQGSPAHRRLPGTEVSA